MAKQGQWFCLAANAAARVSSALLILAWSCRCLLDPGCLEVGTYLAAPVLALTQPQSEPAKEKGSLEGAWCVSARRFLSCRSRRKRHSPVITVRQLKEHADSTETEFVEVGLSGLLLRLGLEM